jgi:O-antigen/teichoic acid export membrane protein
VQLLAVPIAVNALGHDQFALYAMLAAAVGWLSLATIGIGPVLAVGIAEAAATDDRTVERRLFTSALLPILLITLLAGVALQILVRTVPLTALFGPRYLHSADTISAGLALLVGFFLAQCVLSVVEAAQLGYQEQHLLNLATIGGNALSVATIIVAARLAPSVLGMIVAVNGPLLLFRLANAAVFFARRAYLYPAARHFSGSDCRRLLSSGVVFSLASGVGNFFCHLLPVMLVGRALGAEDGTAFAVGMNALIMASGMASVISVSLWPAISDSRARRDIGWTRLAYRRSLLYGTIYGCAMGTMFGLLGAPLFRLWVGPSIHMGAPLLASLGLYCALMMWETVHFHFLIGMKQVMLPSMLYLLRSVFAVVCTQLTLPSLGLGAPFLWLSVSVVLFTLLPLTLATRHQLKMAGRW